MIYIVYPSNLIDILLYRINMDKMLSEISEEEITKKHRTIGQHVKKLRESKKISQLQMALSIGIKSVAFYSNCENSKNDKHFNIEHLYKICKVLNISMSSFFNDIHL